MSWKLGAKGKLILSFLLVFAWLTALSPLSVSDTYYSIYLLCGLAGIEAPSNGCGISLAGRAFGREELTPGRFLYLETTRSCLLIEEGKFKYTRFRNNGAEMLIDLANDPLEQNNLASDPAYADKRRELSSRLDAELSRRGIAPF